MYTMDYANFIVSNQKEEFISIQRVNGLVLSFLEPRNNNSESGS